MNHLPILPFLIPFIAAGLLMLMHGARLGIRRIVSLAATLAGLVSAALLFAQSADGSISVYALGNWPAPFGIVLVADQLAALLVLLLFLLAAPALLMAFGGVDDAGLHFHSLFQLQLAGIAGAFLTGDLFNLFVCFEILLLASYALLVHGSGYLRVRSGLHYVVLNLVGSSLFLVALGIIYGTLGTLNLADIATLLPDVPAADQPLVRTAMALLVMVFLLKAALLPMAFWLPHVYSAATPPVAALFAIMTKVGIVALLRLSVIGFGTAPVTAGLLQPWLPVLALATIAIGTAGAFASRRLAVTVANLVLVSSGTLLFAVAHGSAAATAALLYYLPHTTFVTGGLFLLAGSIAIRRGPLGDRLVRGPVIADQTALALAFAVLAVAISGLPPLSGFIGKLMLMQGVSGAWQAAWWTTLLVSGLGIALVFARAGSIFFWEPQGIAASEIARNRSGLARTLAVLSLVIASPLLVLFARPLSDHVAAAADQLHARTPYIEAVLAAAGTIPRERRPSAAEPESAGQ